MTIYLIVSTALILTVCIILFAYIYKMAKVIVAIAYGIQESFSISQDCYAHLNYTNSSIKLILDHIGEEYNEKMEEAVNDENYEMAKYYKSIIEVVYKLKSMTNNDIEQYQ